MPQQGQCWQLDSCKTTPISPNHLIMKGNIMSDLKFYKGDKGYYPCGQFAANCGLNVQGQTLTEEQLQTFLTQVCNQIIQQGLRKKIGNSVAKNEVAKTLAMYNQQFKQFTTIQISN